MAKDLMQRIAADIQADIKQSLSRENLSGVERRVLGRMDKIKNRETQRGASPAEGGRWNNTYNREYARRRKGGRLSPVTLRNSEENIERTQIRSGNKRSTLSFRNREMAEIFQLHHSGRAKGKKIRQIYPMRDKQVPDSLDEFAENAVFKLLNE